MSNSSLMKVKRIAGFCNTFDLHKAIIGLENQFVVFLKEWPFYIGFTVVLTLNYSLYLELALEIVFPSLRYF